MSADTQNIIELIIPYQEGNAKALLESDGLFIKSIGIEYKRKFTLSSGKPGIFESADFCIALWADRDGTNSLEADLATLWGEAKLSLKEQALPLLRERDAKKKPPAKKAKKPAPAATTTPPPGPKAPPPRPEAAAPGTSAPQAAGVKSGTAELTKIMVQADGKVEFHCKGFRWPFKDSRGAEAVITLFDEALGWKVEHLAPGKLYELTGKGFLVDWEKPEKYYNVVRVHK